VVENQKIVLNKKLPIIFVGMPGSGKSTVAKLISDKLNLPFVDTDLVFQAKFSTTPKDTISKFGELRFRELESQVLNDLRRHNEIILATGGGLPCFYNQMELLNNWGTTVFLDCELSTLAERLKNDSTRPLLNNNLFENLSILHDSRSSIYEMAQIKVNANLNLEELSVKLIELLK